MRAADAATKLSEALSLLSDVMDAGGAEANIAKNIAGVYAAKIVASVDATLAKPGEASAAEFRHWQELLTEFERCGFEFPQAVAALSKLSKRLATRYVSQMTQIEKEVLLRKLEEDLGKENP